MSQIVVSPRGAYCAGLDRVLVNKNIHHSKVAFEVISLGVSACQTRLCKGNVVLGGCRRTMSEPCTECGETTSADEIAEQRCQAIGPVCRN